MVRIEGVEPPTAWFVARYSIQLSYMRTTNQSKNGAHRRSRTSDRLVRSQVLYPAELYAHILFLTTNYISSHLYSVIKSKVARMEGVEPPTAWFVARYSIQLSYMRIILCNLLKIINGGEGGIRTLDGI